MDDIQLDYEKDEENNKLLLMKSPEQSILDLIQTSYLSVLRSPDFKRKLQGIKQHFVNREYDMVFNQPEHLPIYLVNYIPTRALVYYNLFISEPQLLEILNQKGLNICCLGGGPGSELLALCCVALTSKSPLQIIINIHDIADWSEPLEPLLRALEDRWNISEEIISRNFFLSDILDPSPVLLDHVVSANLITLMFTVNELFVYKKKAMYLLSILKEKLQKGTYLLVLDSAGDFSEIVVGKRTYMTYQLFDYLPGFKSIISVDSRWYRYPVTLKYPLKLSNQRYFLRLYQKE